MTKEKCTKDTKKQEEHYKCQQNIDLQNKFCISNVKCDVQHRSGVDFCLVKVAKLRDTKNYSRKSVTETAACLIKPMNRHWNCSNTAVKKNIEYEKLVL